MILGIDTASVAGNKPIDWTRAKAAGLSFAILRAAYGDEADSTFAREWDRTTEAGLLRGAYLYLRFPRGGKQAPDPEAQARALLATLGAVQPADLPPTIDLELPGNGRAETGMTIAECLDWVLRARGVLKAALGVDPILYTSARVWRDDLGNSRTTDLVECPLWLARYYFRAGLPVRSGAAFGQMPAPTVPPPWGADNWWIHQYQGDATGFPGTTGKVDLDRFNPFYTGDGARARWVQRRLGVTVDGRFGAASKAALAAFQTARGLVADRVVGPRTFAYLAWQKV